MVDKERHGMGKCTYADGAEYEGGWLHGASHSPDPNPNPSAPTPTRTLALTLTPALTLKP